MENNLGKRIFYLKIIFLLLLLIVLYTHFRYAFLERNKLLQLGNKLAWREGILYQPRGKIYDSDMNILAWTERYYDLVIKQDFCEKQNIDKINKVLNLIRKSLVPEIPHKKFIIEDLQEDNVVVYGIKPEIDLKKLNEIIDNFEFFAIKPRIVRLIVDHKKIQKIIGKTKIVEGKIIGISGLELKHDKKLSGTPVHYKVMLNRKREWITETFSTSSSEKPENVVLEKNIAKLLEEN
ncbi:hypothetical protein AAEX28_00170 [Lentisphaerota bacterium WC36G]|nr:hypothetical protein LJT99_03050 [Lentisphaerae bacterium WC36]